MIAAVTAAHPLEPAQLDLFLDGRDAFLVHEVVTSILARDHERAARGRARLGAEHPDHPDLPALTLLVDSVEAPPSPAPLTACVETMERDVTPAAQRLLGSQADAFLRPLWQRLATEAAGVPFDDSHPHAHAGWLFQQCAEWASVRAAVEAEAEWGTRPVLRWWLGLARHHLGEREAAIRLWLSLCWADPLFFAEHAATLPEVTLRDGWETFEETVPVDEFLADASHEASWFPAWLLVRHRGLAHLFQPADVPGAGTAALVFRTLLTLVPLEARGLSDEVIARRRELRALGPGFFRYYMDVVGGRRPGR